MKYDLIVVGAGATGLVAANLAHERGRRVLVLERADRPGGRLRTDRDDAYVFDHGFQVLLTAYPAVRKWLDLDALGTRAFLPGAHVLLPDGSRTTVGDPLREPGRLVDTLRSPVGTLADKARLLRLVAYVRSRDSEALFRTPETSTLRFLLEYGFSATVIDRFFRPFYGGIFLERELATSSRCFLFTFKMFAEGSAALPRTGIQAVAEQLAGRLPPATIRYGAEVTSLHGDGVALAGGERLEAHRVIDATSPPGPLPHPTDRWLTTVTLYVAAPRTSLPPRHITLVPGGGPVNNVAVVSGVQPSWSPPDRHLLSLSLYVPAGKTTLAYAQTAAEALAPWLGDELDDWRALRHYDIAHALPFAAHAEWSAPVSRWRGADGVVSTGDWRLHPSLQAAMLAGECAAGAVPQARARVTGVAAGGRPANRAPRDGGP